GAPGRKSGRVVRPSIFAALSASSRPAMYRPTPVRAAARGAALMPTSIKGPEGVAKEAPRVHAIVVTWNGAHLLPDCLKALEAQEPRPHVVVVDNGSIDKTADTVARFPAVELLENETNLGYGRANNRAIERALDA